MRQRIFQLVLVLTSLGLLALTEPELRDAPAPQRQPDSAAIIVLDGMIDNYSRDGLFRRMDEARALGADTVIVELNTPGGLLGAGLDISRAFKRTTDLHIIVFVKEMALSAGTMIALAAHEVVMEPIAMIGDAAPIMMAPGGGVQTLGETERAKAEGPVLTDFRESARMRGYDVLLAESMVSVARQVHWVERIETDEAGNHERRFVTAEQYERLMETGDWRPVPDVQDPVVDSRSLLTLDTEMAMLLGFLSGVYDTPEAMAADRGITVLTRMEPTFGEAVIALLGGMAFRAILMTVFMFSLYMSFSSPGTGVPEVVALTSLGILVGVPMLTGYVEWWEVLIILVGLALIAVEIFLLPGFGIAGITGVMLMLFGFVRTFVPAELPELPGVLPSLDSTWRATQAGLLVVIGGLAASLLLWWWLARFLPKTPYASRLILTTTSGGTAPIDIVPEADAPIFPTIGARGHALTDLRPAGAAQFYDHVINDTRTVDVVSETDFIRSGAEVIVRRVKGGRIYVKAVES